jgi:hypothetical protein
MYFDGHWPFRAGEYSISDVSNSAIHLSAPEKLKLGWLNYRVAQLSGCYELADVETTADALILFSPHRGPDEYFVIENRWRGSSYDAGGGAIGGGLPMDGLAIWHVIDNPAVFDAASPLPPTGVKGEWGRRGIRMIRADGGIPDPVGWTALFSKQGRVISDVTSPARLTWLNGDPSGFRVKLLTDAGPRMLLQITGSNP